MSGDSVAEGELVVGLSTWIGTAYFEPGAVWGILQFSQQVQSTDSSVLAAGGFALGGLLMASGLKSLTADRGQHAPKLRLLARSCYLLSMISYGVIPLLLLLAMLVVVPFIGVLAIVAYGVLWFTLPLASLGTYGLAAGVVTSTFREALRRFQ